MKLNSKNIIIATKTNNTNVLEVVMGETKINLCEGVEKIGINHIRLINKEKNVKIKMQVDIGSNE
jgi:hypothetical protein